MISLTKRQKEQYGRPIQLAAQHPDHILHAGLTKRQNYKVFLNGVLVRYVFYCNLKKGIIRRYKNPWQFDKHRKRMLTETLRGHVTIEPIS